MLYTTRGIVLQQIRYSESSVIVKVLTEQFGLKSYIIKGVHKKRASVKSSLLQHLNLIELVCDNKNYGGLQHPKEIRLEYPYHTLPADILKSSMGLFINEMLLHAIRHEEPDPALFQFLRNALIRLDSLEKPAPDFHLWLCIRLTQHLGFQPQETTEDPRYFNLREGLFCPQEGPEGECMDAACTKGFHTLLNCSPEALEQFTLPYALRLQLLQHLINYYRWHIPDFGEILSHRILSEVLS